MSTDPYTAISDALVTLVQAEFAVEQYQIVHDRLHESIGHKATRIGISIEDQAPQGGNMLVLETAVLIQFYGKYKLEIDPDQRVDPRIVSALAHRLRTRLGAGGVTSSGSLWYFNVLGTTFPEDPTGNKTRFEIRVQAKGENSALVETV